MRKVSDTTCYNVLARNVEAERKLQKEYSTFEWNDPDELIQADITYFNGVPLMAMEDDHSRNGWAANKHN